MDDSVLDSVAYEEATEDVGSSYEAAVMEFQLPELNGQLQSAAMSKIIIDSLFHQRKTLLKELREVQAGLRVKMNILATENQ